ncbi:transporter substrate-binding domain-containing protein [Pseudomonas panipatensis]|uniref:Polar amino acid transport system substrate-binding protein n=1 Tax=Pseudomonas panipatensis TaxID=428992 RepID=A0A1G8MAK0_9PSED|nr:transporter substrate-binding domain-containing protein [Pseudomonas panipatensis]SDI64976.1 polar amino acid transport system substrate-binding protein [Pseudomonas panipatensis]SMP76667.1 amino acid ABC transporter substrate-binding protein, PAAT family [Pseudomonas panipatensis]
MNNKGLCGWLAGATLLMAGVASAQAETLHFALAAEPYPPFSVKQPDGKWTGFEPDLIHKLCAQMQAQCEIDEVAWDGIIPALLAKKVDVIFNSLSITDEREKQIAFSIPYYDTPVAVAAPAATDVVISPEGLKGKTIGVQISTVSSEYLKKYYEKIANVRYYDTQDSVNADLVAGRIDLMLADGIAVGAFLKSPDAQAAGIVSKGEVPYDPVFGRGVGAGLRKDDAALKAKLDSAIGQLLASDDYKALSNQYFGISVAPKQQ